MNLIPLIDKLSVENNLPREELKLLLGNMTTEEEAYLFATARTTAQAVYGRNVFLRGIVEFSNYCRNDCRYCGIRASNANAERYRLSIEQILESCRRAHELGFMTVVLQSGEDLSYSDDDISDIVSEIKRRWPTCAVTLSIGEKTRESYQKYYDAGADRYLLRHETSNPLHYAYLHPSWMSVRNRLRCLEDLKDIGFQVGCGMMVGSPMQTTENILEDLLFMKDFQPHMAGIGPFIPHSGTPFAEESPGSVQLTLHLLSIIRLMLPNVLLPATTALGTSDPMGREKGILAGANVIMPNVSPVFAKKKYILYDGKICTDEDASYCNRCLEMRMKRIGYSISRSRGDYKTLDDFQSVSHIDKT